MNSPNNQNAPEAEADVTSPVEESAPNSATESQILRESQNVPHSVGQPLQATQLSTSSSPPLGDKETVVPLDGGAPPPIPPKNPRTRKDNKRSFRVSPEISAIIENRMESAHVDESTAIRALINEAADKPRILIAPKSPPEHLEALLGTIHDWRRDLYQIRSRLNAPLPRTDDEALVTLVQGWRNTSTRLLEETSKIMELLKLELSLLTSLTSERVEMSHRVFQTMQRAKEHYGKQINDPQQANRRAFNEKWLKESQLVIELLEVLGLSPTPEE